MEDRAIVPTAVSAATRKSPLGAFVSLVVAVLYGASPIDLLPDLIPLIGFVDDAFVVPFLLIVAWGLWRRRARSSVAR